MFASARETINLLTASYPENELEIIADYLGKLVEVWEAERDELRQKSLLQ